MHTIGIYSIKGGVGKTAACVNLSFLSSTDGNRTLVNDLDPQGSATFYFRIRAPKKYTDKSFLSTDKKRNKAIKATDFEHLDLLPADLSFRQLDIHLNKQKHSKRQIESIYQKYSKEYDCIFADCPPNITLVSENIFRAVDLILVPVIPTTLSMLTLEKLKTFFSENGLPQRKIAPFFSMAEQRKRMHKSIIEEYRKGEYGFFQTVIPYLSDVEKMGNYRQPLTFRKPKSPAAVAYSGLWDEIKQLLNSHKK